MFARTVGIYALRQVELNIGKIATIVLMVIIGTTVFAVTILCIEIPVDSQGEYFSWSSLPLAFIYADLVSGKPAAGIPLLSAHLIISFGIPWILLKLIMPRIAGSK